MNSLDHTRICLVEDNKTYAFGIVRSLKSLGCALDTFATAEEALRALRTTPYDLLITDLTLAGQQSGEALVRTQRTTPAMPNPNLPILVLTGDDHEATLIRLFDAGANDYLKKPVSFPELQARVRNLVGIKQQFDRLQADLPGQGKVLFVEDSLTAAHQVMKQLTAHGFQVERHATAELAWQALNQQDYDVLLTDLQLPGPMNGCNLIKRLREQGSRLPAIMLTSNSDEATLLQVFQAGANDYLIKPVKSQELVARLRNMIAIKRQMDGLEEQARVPHASATINSPVNSPVQTSTAETSAPEAEAELPGMDDEDDTFDFLTVYSQAVVRWRWAIMVLSLLFVGLTGYGMSRLVFIDNYEVYFKEDNPLLQSYKRIEDIFTKNYSVLIVLAPQDGDVFTTKTLQTIEDFTEQAWKLPYSLRVDSITNFQRTRGEGDDLVVSYLVKNATKLTAAERADIRATALAEPLLVNRLISPKGHVTGINVTVQLPGKKPDEANEVANAARKLVAEIKAANPETKVYLTGMVMLTDAFFEAAMRDAETLTPLMYGLILVLIGVTLRSISAAILSLMVIAFSTISTMGIVGWLGIPLTSPSASTPTIILTLAVADSVHIISGIFYYMSKGLAKPAAIVESIQLNVLPVFLTSFTTVIGFLGMNFSDSPPLQDLGNMVALGVTIAFLFAVIVLPALAAILPVRARKPLEEETPMTGLSTWIIRYRQLLLWAFPLVTIPLSGFLFTIEFQDNFVEYFAEGMKFRQDTDFTEAHLTGMDTIEYYLKSSGPNGINEPDYLRMIEQFAAWYRKQPHVNHVSILTDVSKHLNRSMNGNDPFHYRVPEERDLAAQYLLLYEMSLPRGLDMNNQVNLDKSASRMTVTLKDATTRNLIDLEEKAYTWLLDNAPQMATRGTSPSLMFAHISKNNIASMVNGTIISVIVISLCIMFALRNVKLALISMIPNIVPMLMAFGLWGMLVGEIGLGVSVVMSITIGIVVDDTIHFLSKYLYIRHYKKAESRQAVRYAFQMVGHSLWVTSVVLVAGFGILALSDFSVNRDMGILSAITIAFALITDIFMLPPLLMLVDHDLGKARNSKTTAPH